MTSKDKGIDDLLAAADALSSAINADTKCAIRQLRAWRELAVKSFDITEGGRAVVTDDYPDINPQSGWYHYRECLCPGQSGAVGEMWINPETLVVLVDFTPETQWSVHDRDSVGERRYLKQHKGCFSFPVKYLRPATADDKPIDVPSGVKP